MTENEDELSLDELDSLLGRQVADGPVPDWRAFLAEREATNETFVPVERDLAEQMRLRYGADLVKVVNDVLRRHLEHADKA